MATSKKTTSSGKRTSRKEVQIETVILPTHASVWQKMHTKVSTLHKRITRRVHGLLTRRPHRSFRRTQRRDYVRPLRLPSYWAFTAYVHKTLWGHKKLFGLLVLAYGVLSIALVGIASQDIYSQLGDTLSLPEMDLFEGVTGEIARAGVLLFSGVTNMTSQGLTQDQQVYVVILALFTWLTTVWLLRGILAGHKPKLRDGLYNAGSPILPTFLVGLVLAIQLLPVGVAAVGFSAAVSTGLLDGGVEAMVFWACATLLGSLSFYWVTSTLVALVVVTLPGMYPMQALKTAGDLVIGRRVRILLRILWLALLLALVWLIIMIPIILFDAWLKDVQPAIEWLPIVPSALLVMSVLTAVWSASYVYLLYRKVVNDDAAPA